MNIDIEEIKNDAILEGLKKYINVKINYIQNIAGDVKNRIDSEESVVKIFNTIREYVDQCEELYKEYSKHKVIQDK